MKKALFPLLLCLCCIVFTGCLGPFPEPINANDFDSVCESVASQYELCIPPTASFVGGYYDHAYRDPGITVLFAVPQADFDTMLSENWKPANRITAPSVLEDQLSLSEFIPDAQYQLNTELYTFLWVQDAEDGQRLCLFSGHNPIRQY